VNNLANKIKNINKIISMEIYIKNKEFYDHLFEVQLPSEDLKLWKPRFNFEMGTPLIADLLLDIEEEKMLEVHPFPEWVVHLKSLDKVNSKPYLIVPNLPKPFIKKLARKSVDERINLIKDEVAKLTIDDLVAFEYEVGINVLVPAFIPHLFISSKINKEAGDSPPYLQVFEPNLETLTKTLKIKLTYFFELPFTVII